MVGAIEVAENELKFAFYGLLRNNQRGKIAISVSINTNNRKREFVFIKFDWIKNLVEILKFLPR